MLKHAFISLDQCDLWKEVMQGIPHCVGQTHAYCLAMASQMKLPVFLYVCRSNDGVLVCPFALRSYRDSKDIVSLYGNSGFSGFGEFPNFQKEWCQFLLDQGFTTAFIGLNQVYDWKHLFSPSETSFSKNTYLIDLQPDLEVIYQKMGRNNRRLLKQWKQKSYTLFYDQDVLHQRFLTLYPNFVQHMKIDKKYQFNSETFDILYKNVNHYYNGVLENGRIVAIRCFLYTDMVADAFLEAHELGINYHSRALYYDGICYLKSRNVRLLNLSGGIAAGDSLEFFKSQLGGDKKKHYVVKLIVDSKKYHKLCQLELDNAQYFPPYYRESEDTIYD